MSTVKKNVYNALPKLPGLDFPELTQRPSYALSQTFVPIPGGRGGLTNIPRDITSMRMTTNHGSTNDPSKSLFTEGAILRRFPLWKTLDDKVLRFFGYFTERVEESTTERGHEMVHKVVVLFFLGDRSVQVSERPSDANTGLRGGIIMSKFYNHGADPFAWQIGETITLRQRHIRLVDCDAFTRDFFAQMGQPLAAADGGEDYPEEYYAKNGLALNGGGRMGSTRRVGGGFDDEDYKQGRRAVETLAVVAKQMPMPQFLSAEEKRNARNFLLHDKEVLNFYAVWNRRHFRISYFLTDGTICISFLKAPNDGRDPVPNFLKRGKIEKPHTDGRTYTLKSIDTVAAPRQVSQDYYTDDDLATGSTLTIMGRDFYIYDCDEFTRNYYRVHKGGREMEAFPRPETEGDEADPFTRRPMVDRTAEIRAKRQAMKPPTSEDVLRFAAVIESSTPQDQGRQFVFCFHCCDNTTAVYELPVRNSGHVGGKIFSRAKVESVKREMLHEGAVIKLGAYTYRLIDCDDRTKAANVPREEQSSATIEQRATRILDRLREQITQRWSRVSDAFLHFNASKRGITLSDLRRMMQECEIRVGGPHGETDEVAARVFERVDRDEDGVISLQEFVRNILRQSLVGGTTADTVQDNRTTANSKQSRAEQLYNARLEQQQRQQVEEAKSLPPMQPNASLRLAKLDAERRRQTHANQVLETFVAKLDARRAFIVDSFRFITDRSADGKIGADCFRKVVRDKMAMHLSEEDLEALVYRFFAADGIEDYENRRITLRDFRRVLNGGWTGAQPEN